jgi:hypothetical protein
MIGSKKVTMDFKLNFLLKVEKEIEIHFIFETIVTPNENTSSVSMKIQFVDHKVPYILSDLIIAFHVSNEVNIRSHSRFFSFFFVYCLFAKKWSFFGRLIFLRFIDT